MIVKLVLFQSFIKFFHTSSSIIEKCFDFVHIDRWGPYKVQCRSSARYFLAVVDDHIRTTLTFLLHNKGQVFFRVLKTFICYVET